MVEEADYDLELAAARVMGRKVAGSYQDDTLVRIQRLLAQELDAGEASQLLREMAASLVLRSEARAAGLIRALYRGLDDSKHRDKEDGTPNP